MLQNQTSPTPPTPSTYSVNFEADEHGQITGTSSFSSIPAGTSYTVSDNKVTLNTATPAEITATAKDTATDYKFDHWEANGQKVTGTGYINANTAFTAVFTIKTFTLYFSVDSS